MAFAVGTGNVAARSANGGPTAAESTCPFGEVGVFSDAALHDALDGIIHVVEVAGRELRVAGAGIEKSGGGRAEATALVEFVEGPSLYFFLLLCGEESHGDAHPEELGRLNTALVREAFSLIDDEVAVVQGLYTEVVELEVGRRVERLSELVDVVVFDLVVEATDFSAVFDVLLEFPLVKSFESSYAVFNNVPTEHLFIDIRELDPGGELGEVRVLLDQGSGVESDGLL